MKQKCVVLPVLLLFCVVGFAPFSAAADLPAETAIDRYVNQPDDSYRWEVVSETTSGGMKTVVVDFVSQTWRTSADVDRPEWQHWLTLAIPEKIGTDIGFLFIGGGRNGRDAPQGPSERVVQIAQATGSVVAELGMVPNQPLEFHNDGQKRTEDDLIGYTWDQYLKTGDETWPARNPMVKSAVRAMDTMTAVMKSETGGNRKVDRFVVAGGSKRGWTTWLTGAVDPRVVGIVPIVIDVLNVNVSMRHHFEAYGFWAPSVGDYVKHRIMERMEHPRLADLYHLVDPYYYRHRLTMPKLVLNASGDQFFLPDSSQFYWDDLEGPKSLRYVPNADHGLGGSDGLESVIAFYSLLLQGREAPKYDWTVDDDGAFHVTTEQTPVEVRLWQATNPEARDFRVETLGREYASSVVEATKPGLYVANVEQPSEGWRAYFVELTYDVGAPVPLKLTTSVKVVPDTLPYAGKDVSQPATLTIVCTAANVDKARQLVEDAEDFVEIQMLSQTKLICSRDGKRCYLNCCPSGDFEECAKLLTGWLSEQGAEGFRYQLESGPGITKP